MGNKHSHEMYKHVAHFLSVNVLICIGRDAENSALLTLKKGKDAIKDKV